MPPTRTDATRARDRKRMAERKRRGICSRCPAKAEPGRLMCRFHLDAKRDWERKRPKKRKPPGTCSGGGCLRPASPGRVLCFECRMSNSRAYQRRQDAGLCAKCRSPRVPGKSHCAQHLAKRNDEQREAAQKKRAAGLCAKPGCSAESPNFYWCFAHRLQWADQRRVRVYGDDTAPVVVPEPTSGNGDDLSVVAERML